jgi:hypothetical protein
VAWTVAWAGGGVSAPAEDGPAVATASGAEEDVATSGGVTGAGGGVSAPAEDGPAEDGAVATAGGAEEGVATGGGVACTVAAGGGLAADTPVVARDWTLLEVGGDAPVTAALGEATAWTVAATTAGVAAAAGWDSAGVGIGEPGVLAASVDVGGGGDADCGGVDGVDGAGGAWAIWRTVALLAEAAAEPVRAKAWAPAVECGWARASAAG